ncbi:M48 family metalloprotease [Ideonella sp. YS5]|uniref:M48 family metalloprotease n=1 Tax=Ideonella sp. YS5 TaxID=3453714 RepID=UPI003EF065D3
MTAPGETGSALRRWSLGLLSLAGSVSYQVIVLAPLAMVMCLNALWFNLPWAWWLTGLTLLGAWWLMQGGEAPAGTLVGRDQAPAFWDRLDALADRMRAPRVARVVLTHEPGAAAIAHQDAWLPWRHHHTLALGVPLLASLPADEMEAVIAHELAHLSRHFGPAGHWLYRSRLGWTQLLQGADDDIVWYRLAAGFARRFVPLFERHSASEAVRCEYEADALSARVTSPEQLARGLARLAAARAGERTCFGDGPLPLDPLGDSMPQLSRAMAPAVLMQALREDDAWHALQDPLEATHPPVSERLRALGVQGGMLVVPGVGQAAGPAWWGDAWGDCLGAENALWRARHARAWRHEAAWRDACARQVDGAAGEQALECALALDRCPMPPQDADAPTGQPPLAAFWTGVAWLPHDPLRAQRWLESSIRDCVALAAPARRRLVELQSPAFDDATRQRQQGLLSVALQRRDAARERSESLGLAAGRPVCAEPWRLVPLAQALAADEPVLQAAWVEHDVTLPSGRRYAVVTLCLQIAIDGGAPERGVGEAYAALLARVITPARVGHVRTWWSTESWPEALAAEGVALKSASTVDCGLHPGLRNSAG